MNSLVFGRRRGWVGAVAAAVTLLAAVGLQAQTTLQKALFDEEVASHWIYDDFNRAVAQARTSGKPILALLRCVP